VAVEQITTIKEEISELQAEADGFKLKMKGLDLARKDEIV